MQGTLHIPSRQNVTNDSINGAASGTPGCAPGPVPESDVFQNLVKPLHHA